MNRMKAFHRKDAKAQKAIFLVILLIIVSVSLQAQRSSMRWAPEGHSYYKIEKGEITRYDLPENTPTVVITKQQLTPQGSENPLKFTFYQFSADQQKVLLFTNTKRVWRLNSRGDYWVFDRTAGTLNRLGKTLPASSLMFAKFSPDGKMAAYVSGNNLYAEELGTGKITPLTTNGSVTMINGTFDWVYEEEFACREGFRWSPDGRSVAYWQLDASTTKKFYMIDNTDSIYSKPIPIEYPKVGEPPSSCRVGVVTIDNPRTTWIDIPGDPVQNYIVRMEFIPGSEKLLIQQLNRKQNVSRLFTAEPTGKATRIQEESDTTWVDLFQPGNPYALDYTNNFLWIKSMNSILWASEKDGWRHFYQVPLDGKPEKLITAGNFDVIDYKYTDEKEGYVYYMASPSNATQKYLYRSRLNGKGSPERISPDRLKGTHDYSFSADGLYAVHAFSNHFTLPGKEMITLAGHQPLTAKESILNRLDSLEKPATTEFFKVTTVDGVEMDGWMVKPKDFDPAKKYPVVFYVYTEPASTTVDDTYGTGLNGLYDGSMRDDGYIYVSLDNRGTPAPKGRAWRHSIYRHVGRINIHDQAMGAKEVLKWSFIDPDRVAVWGWSGGGSATLNLMFQYPKIYKTGIAIAAVSNLLTYDNIYQERYMGLPQENLQDFTDGSPITYAKNLEGNLLFIHGTGDDNVHYQNAEMLLNELVKNQKQFRFMPYPNRTHGISEGEGTSQHLSALFTSYLKEKCPPGGR